MQRRQFIQSVAGLGIAASLDSTFLHARSFHASKRPPRILLRSSWQVVNIGDVAHTPGVLALIETHIPEAEVILWASNDLSDEVAAMEHRRFPKLKIVKGTIGANGKASNTELAEAMEWTDFLLHGSGPSLVAYKDVAALVKHIEKPFGVYGITYSGAEEAQRELLSSAKFVYFRDSVSLAKAKTEGITCPIMEFGPDGAFAVDLRNDEAAEKFMNANQLEKGKFVCCIPRLRNTPYWLIRNKEMTDIDRAKQVRNEEMQEHDHQPLRDAIAAVVKETDLKVLLCPEDRSQMEVGRRLILEKIPDAVRSRVVWRKDFWLTDEALSTYVQSAGLFGLEMHSPIMCIGNGIPALVGRFAEQTSKGFMWRDIGLNDWLFDLDQPGEGAKIASVLLEMLQNKSESQAKVAAARQVVEARQAATMATLKLALVS